VCVYERERKRKIACVRVIETVCAYVCVCVRERERERERECVRVFESE